MDPNAMGPHGRALLDCFSGKDGVTIIMHREDGYRSDLPIDSFFRQPADFSPLEQAAMALCRGRVLDVGAGAGCHSLYLQKQGHDVLAVDIAPAAVEIMRKRGVRQVRCSDIFALDEGPFDTLLLMMHGIGLVETLSGLDRFLDHARKLVAHDGQIVLDSLDVGVTSDPAHLAYHEANRRAGRYAGEIRTRFEYQGQMGPQFGWLHVDSETLSKHAQRAGWTSRVVRQGPSGNYLAQLERRQ